MASYLVLGNKGMRLEDKVKELSKYEIIHLERFDVDILDELYLSPTPASYVIDLAEITKNHRTEKIQNSILKFIEEPPGECDVYILMPSINGVLPTIANRCKKIKVPDLTKEEVKERLKGLGIADTHLCMIKTLDDVDDYDFEKCENILHTCKTMLKYLPTVTVSNALQIADKIDFDGRDEDKYNINLYNIDWFIAALEQCLLNKVEKGEIDSVIATYLSRDITTFKSMVKVLGINKRYLFERLILQLMEDFKNDSRRI